MIFKLEELSEDVQFPCPVYNLKGVKVAKPGVRFSAERKLQLLSWKLASVEADCSPFVKKDEKKTGDKCKQFSVRDVVTGMFFDFSLFAPGGKKLLERRTEISAAQIRQIQQWGIEKLDSRTTPRRRSGGGENSSNKRINFKKEYKQFVQKTYRDSLKRTEELLGLLTGWKLDSLEPFLELIRTVLHGCRRHRLLILYYLAAQRVKNEDYIYKYSLNTALISLLIGDWLNLGKRELWQLGVAGLLHDAGMLMIPQEIRKNSDDFTPEQRREMQKHLGKALPVIDNLEGADKSLLKAVAQHHERYDGSGYPDGLVGDEIHLHARIINLAMNYVALKQPRYNRPEHGLRGSIRKVILESRKRFSPQVLEAFLNLVGIYPPGSIVRLKNGELALVIKPRYDNYLEPLVRILTDSEGEPLRQQYDIRLSESDKAIDRMLNNDEHEFNAFKIV